MFDERDPREMSNGTVQSTGATVGQNPNLPQSSTVPVAPMPPGVRRTGSKQPVGTRIVDMTNQVFMPSRIQPKPDIALEYIDAKGKPAPRLKGDVEREFLDDVAAQGIKSIRIGYTTNGRHKLNSNHPRGLAADIDMINGKLVNTYHQDQEVKALVDSIINRFNARHDHEVYGPGKQLYRDRKPFNNPDLAKEHEGHIHWTRRR